MSYQRKLAKHPLAHRLVVMDTRPQTFNYPYWMIYIGFKETTQGRLSGKLTHLSEELVRALEIKSDIEEQGGSAHLEFPEKVFAECAWRCTDTNHTGQCKQRRGIKRERDQK